MERQVLSGVSVTLHPRRDRDIRRHQNDTIFGWRVAGNILRRFQEGSGLGSLLHAACSRMHPAPLTGNACENHLGAHRLAHGTEMVRGKVYFSGTLITCIFNMLLIICLGTHDEGIDYHHDEEYGNGKHHHAGVRMHSVLTEFLETCWEPLAAHSQMI